jgi:hypothetical protein
METERDEKDRQIQRQRETEGERQAEKEKGRILNFWSFSFSPAGLPLTIHLPLPPAYWDYRCELPHVVKRDLLQEIVSQGW